MNETLLPTLKTACSEAEILDALARLVYKVHGEGEPEIPTVEALAGWLPMAPETARVEADELLKQLPWHLFLDEILKKDGDLKRARWQTATADDREVLDTPEVHAKLNFGGVHLLWRDADPQPRHPLAPLVRAWWKRPVEVEDRNDRPDAIYPAPLVHVNRNDRRAGLFSPAIWAATRQGTKDQFDLFPGFGPGEAQGPIVPALPLALYDLGGSGAMTRGGPGAAPLALRIFVETVLSANGPGNSRARQRDAPLPLPPQQFGDWLATLYPVSAEWRRGKQLPALLDALYSLTAPSTRIPWEDPETGRGAARLIVVPVDIPRSGRRDDWIRFEVHLPPGSERGALVDRLALRQAGTVSAAAYRLALSLAFWWHDPGKMRVPIPKGRGRPGKLWRQARQLERYPEVTDAELIAMAYPRDAGDVGSTRRSRLQRVREALDYLGSIGYADCRPGQRLLPGPPSHQNQRLLAARTSTVR